MENGIVLVVEKSLLDTVVERTGTAKVCTNVEIQKYAFIWEMFVMSMTIVHWWMTNLYVR